MVASAVFPVGQDAAHALFSMTWFAGQHRWLEESPIATFGGAHVQLWTGVFIEQVGGGPVVPPPPPPPVDMLTDTDDCDSCVGFAVSLHPTVMSYVPVAGSCPVVGVKENVFVETPAVLALVAVHVPSQPFPIPQLHCAGLFTVPVILAGFAVAPCAGLVIVTLNGAGGVRGVKRTSVQRFHVPPLPSQLKAMSWHVSCM